MAWTASLALQDMKYQEALNAVLEKHYQKEQQLLTKKEREQQQLDLKCGPKEGSKDSTWGKT
jgi:hypothetical protein